MSNNLNANNPARSLVDLLKGGVPDSYNVDYGQIKEYYLSEEIGEPINYVHWFHEIRNARQTDIIKIHINCPGGNLFTTIQFIQAIAETEAHIIASVEGACMSAATLIFLMADEFMITDHSMFLFHNYSGGTVGKGGEMYHGVIHERKWSEQLLRDIYSDFLTESEITSMINDKDIWMDSQQVIDRLEKRGKKIQSRLRAQEKKKKV